MYIRPRAQSCGVPHHAPLGGQPAAAPRQAIVVLPFANLSPDPENAYFGDGLMEEVIGDLSRVRALRVISGTSSVKLKETGWDLRRIGGELNVRYTLEGSVRRAGSTLRITAQLNRRRDRGPPPGGDVRRHGGRRVRSPGAAVAPDRGGPYTAEGMAAARALAEHELAVVGPNEALYGMLGTMYAWSGTVHDGDEETTLWEAEVCARRAFE